MARNPVSVFKRPSRKQRHYFWYVKLWNEAAGKYSTARSAGELVLELGLDPKKFSATSRTGALLIGDELRKKGGAPTPNQVPLFVDYCASIWDWDSSPYIQGKLLRGQRIVKEYAAGNASCIRNHVRDAFPTLRLDAVRLFMLEDFAMKLKKESVFSVKRNSRNSPHALPGKRHGKFPAFTFGNIPS